MYFRDKIIIEYSYIIYSCINIKHTSCVVDSFDYENRRAIDSEIIDNENSETMTKIDDTSAEIRRSRKQGGGGGWIETKTRIEGIARKQLQPLWFINIHANIAINSRQVSRDRYALYIVSKAVQSIVYYANI